MFQTHLKALEELSFALDTKDLANFKATLEYLLQQNYLTIPHTEVKKALDAIDKIGALQLEGKIYAFHLDDTWQAEQDGGSGEGYELFERRGNTLKDYLFREYDTLPTDEILTQLKKDKFTTIYTGNIPVMGEFLGIKYKSIDDSDGHSMTYRMLEDREIEKFEEYGIQVIVLDSLI